MHEHGNQPYRRTRDDAIVTERALWSATDSSEAGRREVRFRVGRCGSVRMEVDGEAQYVQFLPPYMADMSAPAEVIVAADGLCRDRDSGAAERPYLRRSGRGFRRGARRRYPGRFIGLAQVQEAWAFRDDQIARLVDQVKRLGMTGLYFTYSGLFRSGYGTRPSDPATIRSGAR